MSCLTGKAGRTSTNVLANEHYATPHNSSRSLSRARRDQQCVDEVVATATSSRALSAFLACGTHRSPTIRAKSALAILLCIQRRYHTARDTSASECSTTTTTTTPATARGRGSNGFEGGGGCGISSMAGGGRGVGVSGGGTVSGSGGIIGTREMDRLLSALPRFLQVHTGLRPADERSICSCARLYVRQ